MLCNAQVEALFDSVTILSRGIRYNEAVIFYLRGKKNHGIFFSEGKTVI